VDRGYPEDIYGYGYFRKLYMFLVIGVLFLNSVKNGVGGKL